MIFKVLLIFITFFSIIIPISADNEEGPPFEVGFWLGAANPLPGSQTAKKLDSTLGLGVFTRFPGPFMFLSEFGMGVSNYQSKTERGLTAIPVYGALAYKLPIELPISIFLRGGAGAAYVIARPSNTAKWDPMALLGVETSFVAGRKVRIGLRMDYQRIFETIANEPPTAAQRYYFSPLDRDYRLSNPNYYQLKDVEFFHFSLMVS
ncbi:MAG: hypothetical protein KDK36_08735, partial [Leptospiraceae bacterium]|nr:hypothetical protein [Leptospiraceae bacterium]